MGIGGVGGSSGALPNWSTGTTPGSSSATSTGATGESASTTSTDTKNTSGGGGVSLIGADGKVRTGWGEVDAPPEPPIKNYGGEEMHAFGNVETPPPPKTGDAPPVHNAEAPAKPEETKPREPIHKTKFSIITGPPQGDP